MTYEDAIKNTIGVNEHINGRPICFPFFITSLSGVICEVVWQIIQTLPNGEIRQGSKVIGQTPKKATIHDVIEALCGQNIFTGITITFQIQQFIDWLLDQEIEENEEELPDWYDAGTLSRKWNEYVAQIKGVSE